MAGIAVGRKLDDICSHNRAKMALHSIGVQLHRIEFGSNFAYIAAQ